MVDALLPLPRHASPKLYAQFNNMRILLRQLCVGLQDVGPPYTPKSLWWYLADANAQLAINSVFPLGDAHIHKLTAQDITPVVSSSFIHISLVEQVCVKALGILLIRVASQKYQKDAIYRQMLEYKREKATLESQLKDVQKRSVDHDDHLRIIDAWWSQVNISTSWDW